MATRVVCPHCGEKLLLRKPAIDSTKVKCASCRGKFYAAEGDDTQLVAAAATADTAVSQALIETPRPVRAVHRREPESVDIGPAGPAVPTWLVPVGLVALIGLSIAGFNSRPAVAPPTGVAVPATFIRGDASPAPVRP